MANSASENIISSDTSNQAPRDPYNLLPDLREKPSDAGSNLKQHAPVEDAPIDPPQADVLALVMRQLDELRHLREIAHASLRITQEEKLQQSKLEIVFVWLCQLLGIILAGLFGVYTVLSFYAAENASSQADTANQIALLSLCMGIVSQGSQIQFQDFAGQQAVIDTSVCGNLTYSASSVFSSLAADLFPSVDLTGAPAPTPITTTILISSATSGSSSVLGSDTLATSTVTGTAPPLGSAPTGTSSSSGAGTSSSAPGSSSSPGLSTAQKAAVGVGVGIGLPAMILALMTAGRTVQKLSKSRKSIPVVGAGAMSGYG